MRGVRGRNVSHTGTRELGPVPAREPAKERAERSAHLRRKRDIGRVADKDAKQQTHQGSKADDGSDAHVARVYARSEVTDTAESQQQATKQSARGQPVLRHANHASRAHASSG